MKQRIAIFILAALAQLAVGRAAFSQADPANKPAESIAQMRDAEKQSLAEQWKDVQTLAPQYSGAVIQFSLVNGLLVVTSPKFDGQVVNGIIPFTNLPDRAMLRVAMAAGSSFIALDYYNYSDPRVVFRHVQVLSSPGSIQIAYDLQMPDDTQTVSLTQNVHEDERSVSLKIQKISENAAQAMNQTFSASTLAEFFRDHPDETARYIRPMFRLLRADSGILGVDDRAAWQVLGDTCTPDPALVQQVQALLPALNSDEYAVRADADRKLRGLGGGAAIYLESMDRARLSPEQQARIDTFIIDYQPLSEQDAQSFGRDVGFLLDCLDSKDVEVRQLALDRVRKITGHEVKFDLEQPAAQRAAAIQELRVQLMPPPTRAATQGAGH